MIMNMGGVILGSEALAKGLLTRGQLRWNYRCIFRDVYIPNDACRSLELMTIGAWLWSGRRAITMRAAAARQGAKWVDEYTPVELLWRNNHHPPGAIVRNERFGPDEVVTVPRERDPILLDTFRGPWPSPTSMRSPAQQASFKPT
jgi:hypothetical protein